MGVGVHFPRPEDGRPHRPCSGRRGRMGDRVLGRPGRRLPAPPGAGRPGLVGWRIPKEARRNGQSPDKAVRASVGKLVTTGLTAFDVRSQALALGPGHGPRRPAECPTELSVSQFAPDCSRGLPSDIHPPLPGTRPGFSVAVINPMTIVQRKRGRPQKSPGERRTAELRIRLTAAERQALDRAAGGGTSTWARAILLLAAVTYGRAKRAGKG